jgi:hypothetical protein
MGARSPELQAFLDAFREAIAARAAPASPTALAAARIFGAIEVAARASPPEPGRVACCRHLEPVLGSAARAQAPVARLAHAFGSLEPQLQWIVRGNAAEVGEPFLSGHANAYMVGPDQLESRQDVWVGVSLMAPGITYPDHDHAPEEVYVALSPGQWRQNDEPWIEPGVGGLIYNPPGIRHAMRSGREPFLAAWCLWVG